MSTLGQVVTRVQQLVLSDQREETNYLGANINASTTTVTLAAGNTLGSIQPGAYIQIGYELMLVTAAASTSSITVIRGFGNSTAAAATAPAVINVNPRFPAVEIIQAINQDIDDLTAPSNGLYQMLELTATFIPVQQGYDMTGVTPANVMEIWEIRAYEYGPAKKYPIISPQAIKVQRNADTAVFPSGMSFTLDEPGYAGRPLRVQYKAPYTTPLVNATDDLLTVTGIHTQAQDIPELGAACRLMDFRELKRSFTEAQGEPRRAQEVPVGSSLTAQKGLMALREQRIMAERTRLNKMWPRQSR